MKIALVNPNSTASMTERIAHAARAAAAPGTIILHGQPAGSPPAIEGVVDGAMAVPGMLSHIRTSDMAGVDAHIIACFDDTGLDAARAISDRPVVGIGEASMLLASLVARRFCVVTTLSRSVPVIEDNIMRYGLGQRCPHVYASDIPVLALDDPSSGAFERIAALIEKGRDNGAEAAVLGCAGMTEMARRLQERCRMPIVEGVRAAVGLAEQLVSADLSSAKSGMWSTPARLPELVQL